MNIRKKYLIVAIIILIILGILYLPQFIFVYKPSSTTNQAERFFKSTVLTLVGTPSINNTVNLTFTVRAFNYVEPNSSLEIILPRGFELISGSLIWKGYIPPNDMFQLNVTVKANETGTWLIGAWAGPARNVKYDRANIYVTVEQKIGHFSYDAPICSGTIFEVMECMRSGSVKI